VAWLRKRAGGRGGLVLPEWGMIKALNVMPCLGGYRQVHCTAPHNFCPAKQQCKGGDGLNRLIPYYMYTFCTVCNMHAVSNTARWKADASTIFTSTLWLCLSPVQCNTPTIEIRKMPNWIKHFLWNTTLYLFAGFLPNWNFSQISVYVVKFWNSFIIY